MSDYIVRMIKAGGVEVTSSNKIRRADVPKVKHIIAKISEFNVRFGVSGSEGDSADSMYLRQDTLEELIPLFKEKGFELVDQDDHWCETGEAGCTLILSGDREKFMKAFNSLDSSEIHQGCVSISVDEGGGEFSVSCEFEFEDGEDEEDDEEDEEDEEVEDASNIVIKVDGRMMTIEELKEVEVVQSYLNLSNLGLTKLPDLSHLKVAGNFYCDGNKLTSLEGAPKEVAGDFDCSYNKLTSLRGATQKVGGDFDCTYNKLTSLQGAPEGVGKNFSCFHNKLISLQGAPKGVGGSFWCHSNNLTSLQGAPMKVGGDFDCANNNREFTVDEVREVSNVNGKINN